VDDEGIGRRPAFGGVYGCDGLSSGSIRT